VEYDAAGLSAVADLRYAFALFAHLRGEENPPWARHLRLDAASALKDGLRYLRKTNDTLCHPDTIRQPNRPPTPAEALQRLRSNSATVRLATLWVLREGANVGPEVVAAVTECLHDGDPAIPGEAARTLAGFGDAVASAAPQLVKALSSVHDDTRAGAAYALGVMRLQPAEVIPVLGYMVQEDDLDLVAVAAAALQNYGRQAEPAAPRLLPALKRALVECDDGLIATLTSTLAGITTDPRQLVREYFHADRELLALALEAFGEEQGGKRRNK
jgi:HEAT repeat protein